MDPRIKIRIKYPDPYYFIEDTEKFFKKVFIFNLEKKFFFLKIFKKVHIFELPHRVPTWQKTFLMATEMSWQNPYPDP